MGAFRICARADGALQMSAKMRTKTEHVGAKNGGSSFYGRRAQAKGVTKRLRRLLGKLAIRQELREI